MDKKSDDSASLAALRQRFPKPNGAAAAYQCAVILLTNGYLLYLVIRGQSSPLALAAFNICELLLLSVIAHLALVPVPKAHRLVDAQAGGIVQRVGILALMAVWLGFVYSFSLFAGDKAHIDQLRHAGSVFGALEDLNIVWPLLLSAATTLAATIGDWAWWHRRGGIFVPQMAVSSAPKILTLVLAPLPATLFSAGLMKAHPEAAPIVWSLIYIGIKAAAELGILAWQYAGMPAGAKDMGGKVSPLD